MRAANQHAPSESKAATRMNEVVAKSWNDLFDKLFADAWSEALQRFRSPYAFRGMPLAEDTLQTTLMRLGGEFWTLEQHLLRNFKKYAHQDVVQRDSVWHWLSVAQHHGLPTRLLDWTYSPLVALHFATSDYRLFNADGVVWKVNFAKVHQLLPQKLRTALSREGGDVFTVEALAEMLGSLQDLDGLSSECGPFAVFFEPPSIDQRIANQFAYFSTVSSVRVRMDEWLRQHDALATRIIIPAGLKWEIRDKLDQSNVTERVLFPGLDGLCRWLARHYYPRQADQNSEAVRFSPQP